MARPLGTLITALASFIIPGIRRRGIGGEGKRLLFATIDQPVWCSRRNQETVAGMNRSLVIPEFDVQIPLEQ